MNGDQSIFDVYGSAAPDAGEFYAMQNGGHMLGQDEYSDYNDQNLQDTIDSAYADAGWASYTDAEIDSVLNPAVLSYETSDEAQKALIDQAFADSGMGDYDKTTLTDAEINGLLSGSVTPESIAANSPDQSFFSKLSSSLGLGSTGGGGFSIGGGGGGGKQSVPMTAPITSKVAASSSTSASSSNSLIMIGGLALLAVLLLRGR